MCSQDFRFAGPLPPGSLIKVPPVWRRIEYDDPGTEASRFLPNISAGTLKTGKVLNIATFACGAAQFISYSGFRLSMHSIAFLRPKLRRDHHLILNNVNQYAWRNATTQTVQALTVKEGVNLSLSPHHPHQAIYACRISFGAWKGAKRTGCAFVAHQHNAAAADHHRLLIGQYRAGERAPRFQYAGRSNSRSKFEETFEFELLCYKNSQLTMKSHSSQMMGTCSSLYLKPTCWHCYNLRAEKPWHI